MQQTFTWSTNPERSVRENPGSTRGALQILLLELDARLISYHQGNLELLADWLFVLSVVSVVNFIGVRLRPLVTLQQIVTVVSQNATWMREKDGFVSWLQCQMVRVRNSARIGAPLLEPERDGFVEKRNHITSSPALNEKTSFRLVLVLFEQRPGATSPQTINCLSHSLVTPWECSIYLVPTPVSRLYLCKCLPRTGSKAWSLCLAVSSEALRIFGTCSVLQSAWYTLPWSFNDLYLQQAGQRTYMLLEAAGNASISFLFLTLCLYLLAYDDMSHCYRYFRNLVKSKIVWKMTSRMQRFMEMLISMTCFTLRATKKLAIWVFTLWGHWMYFQASSILLKHLSSVIVGEQRQIQFQWWTNIEHFQRTKLSRLDLGTGSVFLLSIWTVT